MNYDGYFKKDDNTKGAHWYIVECMSCGSEYRRMQGSLTRAIEKGTRGCAKCAKERFKQDKAQAKERESREIEERLQMWLWANFLMPVTSLRWRYENERAFDSENSKVMGWRLI